MEISIKSKVSTVIKHNIAAIDAIAAINPHFEKLRNPILRRLLAPRVTLEEAAKIGKCDVSILIEKLKTIGFTFTENSISTNQHSPELKQVSEFKSTSSQQLETIVLDVQEMLGKNEDPFNVIIDKVQHLEPTQQLSVLSPLEPIPLIRILTNKGYSCFCKENSGVYNTLIHLGSSIETPINDQDAHQITQGQLNLLLQQFIGNREEIDVREMEMPEPMIRILEKLSELPSKSALFVQHKKIPQYLLPELEARNFIYHIHCISEYNVQLLIHHKH